MHTCMYVKYLRSIIHIKEIKLIYSMHTINSEITRLLDPSLHLFHPIIPSSGHPCATHRSPYRKQMPGSQPLGTPQALLSTVILSLV